MYRVSGRIARTSVRIEQLRNSSGGSSSGSSGGGGKAFVGVVLGTACAGGAVLAYEHVDPEFRSNVEQYLPPVAQVNKLILGDVPVGSLQPAPIKSLTPNSPVTVQKVKPDERKAIHAANANEGTALPEPQKTNAPQKPEDKPPHGKVKKSPYEGPGDSFKKNEDLDHRVRGVLQSAESKIHAATRAKYDHIAAVEAHVTAIRSAVEAGPEGDWDAVTNAHQDAIKASKKDKLAEVDGRNYLDNLDKVISDGLRGEETVVNPILAVARESSKKMKKQLDEVNAMFKAVQTEEIFVKDYAKVVEEGRKRFSIELNAVVPGAKIEEGAELNKKQLDALLAHAHLKVDQLQRQLFEQKLKEDERITKVLNEEKDKQLHELKHQLEKEIREHERDVVKCETGKVAADKKPISEEKRKDVPEIRPVVIVAHQTKPDTKPHTCAPEVEIARLKKNFELELKKSLAANEEQYTQKLEQVVRTQRQLFDIEKEDSLTAAVTIERQMHASQIAYVLMHLEGIEKALKDRVVMDAENRRAKQLWMACQNVVDSVEYGKRGSCCIEGRRFPLQQQMQVIQKAAPEDKFVKVLDDVMGKVAKVKGEYTRDDLKTRLEKVHKLGHRVARVDDNGGGLGGFMRSWLVDCLSFSLPVTYKKTDKIDPRLETNAQLLDRAEWLWKKEDYIGAVKVLQCTTGPARRLASDWIKDARSHEETLMITRLLLAHAACTSVRSTY